MCVTSFEFTEDDLPRDLSQPEVVAGHVREVFDSDSPVRITDVARDLEMNYGTFKTYAPGGTDGPTHAGDANGVSVGERTAAEDHVPVGEDDLADCWAEVVIDATENTG